ncbi:hypothetical protein [Streptosporangium sp. NPDC006007]|uniref:hypothetical protein n=1 Tax=Streptosporangium sp. NPDC006007 TaxID=3154575 RepID=UPI0033B2D5FC
MGSFQLRERHFLQLWCDDAELRRRAVQERALGMARLREVRTREDPVARIDGLATQLEVAPPTLAHLRAYANSRCMHDHLVHLDALE